MPPARSPGQPRACRMPGRGFPRPSRTAAWPSKRSSYRPRYKASTAATKWQMRPDLPLSRISRSFRRQWRLSRPQPNSEPNAQAYRCVGSITIARAASTQREIDAMPDPLTHRPQRGREDGHGRRLADLSNGPGPGRQGRRRKSRHPGPARARLPRPTRRHRSGPEEPPGALRVLNEVGEWVSEAGSTLVGLVGFLGAVLIAFASDHPLAQAIPPQCGHPALRPRRGARAGHHRPDELPDRHRHWPAGRGPAPASSARKSIPST